MTQRGFVTYLERFLDAGGMAIIGVVVGAFLTYLFGALTRRRQEKREDRTRWYERRLQAYIEFYQTVYEVFFSLGATALRTKRPLTDDEAEASFSGF
jgi:membrane protein YqaA with SNARE-associated domain